MFQHNLQNFNCQTFCDDSDNAITNFFRINNDIKKNNFSNLFSVFIKVVQDIINFHAPYKKLWRKQVKLKLKPCIAKGLLKSIKHKQKLYITRFIHGNFSQKQQYKKDANKLDKIQFKSKNFSIKKNYKNFNIMHFKRGTLLNL